MAGTMTDFGELLEPGTPVPPGGPGTPDPAKEKKDAADAMRKKAQRFGIPGYATGTANVGGPPTDPSWLAKLDELFRAGTEREGRSPVPLTKGGQGPMRPVSPGPAAPGQAQQLLEQMHLRGSQPSTRIAAMGDVGKTMGQAAQTPPVSPMMKAMGQGAQNAANFAAPAAEAAPAAKGAGLLATAKGMLPIAAKGLGIGGQLADAYTQVVDPNSSGNQIAAATKARTDALAAKGQNAAALGSNIRGIAEQAFNMSPFGAAARLGATAAPVLRDFATGLFGGDPTAPAAPGHPSASPVVAAAANIAARVEGRPDMHSTHPTAHTAEDWARANSHLTLGQLQALMALHPKPRSSKDVIAAQANNAIEQLYQQDLLNAKGAKAKSFWGNDADAQQQAAHSATLLRLQRLLGLAQGAAAPMAATTLTPAEE